MKKGLRKIHRYIGLIVGIITFISSITGALLVFKDDIQEITRNNFIYHKYKSNDQNTFLKISQILDVVKEQNENDYPIGWITVPIDKSRSYEIHYYDRDYSAWNYYDEFKVYKTIYINPYTGEIIKVINEKKDFFFILLRLHFALLLGTNIGSFIVSISTILFLIMLSTGIVLWLPKRYKNLKKKIWFRWEKSTNWKRKNYDLHNIFGVYIFLPAFIIAFTGLFFAYDILPKTAFYIATKGKIKQSDYENTKNTFDVNTKHILPRMEVIDKISSQVDSLYPYASHYNLIPQVILNNKNETISIKVFGERNKTYIQHEIFFNNKNGEILKNCPYSKKIIAEKIVLSNYDIHTGSILGLSTKIIAFIVSLLCAILPITGYIIYYKRK
ncbi:PepSY-associated TM helix domain-containing protein [Riemerella columbina]|uniref:PepSY-associated TM helix domain-containing protein n=1 Tax=Riemerella columbina TaxID=103810 RepID=UPI000374B116|nr:PepSY-associated TM helix domain-containing protein [Riemerella columbina]